MVLLRHLPLNNFPAVAVLQVRKASPRNLDVNWLRT